jgi:hypothetical protein
MRIALQRLGATRKKLLAQYDKLEKPLLTALVREKAASIREAKEAAGQDDSRGALHGRDLDPIDWYDYSYCYELMLKQEKAYSTKG